MSCLRTGFLAAVTLVTACASHDPRSTRAPAPAVASFELQPNLGRWYVIAQTRAPGARREVGVPLDLSPRDAGALELVRTAQPQDFAQKPERRAVLARAEAGRWTLQSKAFGTTELSVLWLDAESRYAALGDDARQQAWVLAREARMPDERYAQVLEYLHPLGYDVERLRKFAQVGDQLDAPGYE